MMMRRLRGAAGGESNEQNYGKLEGDFGGNACKFTSYLLVNLFTNSNMLMGQSTHLLASGDSNRLEGCSDSWREDATLFATGDCGCEFCGFTCTMGASLGIPSEPLPRILKSL